MKHENYKGHRLVYQEGKTTTLKDRLWLIYAAIFERKLIGLVIE